MFFLLRKSGGTALVALLLSGISLCVAARDRSEDAAALVSSAMDAYSNLEMEKAKGFLDQALALQDNIDAATLAKVHVGLGVLWVGGYSNSTASKTSFITALCLDENAKVDPLFSTPEIDLSFTEAKNSVSPSACRELGIKGAELEPCGAYEPLVEQKKSYELPFYLDVSPTMRNQVSKVSVMYSFDSKEQYRELPLESRGDGYGALVECDTGEIRTINPETVSYYIEGYDDLGRVICGNGSKEEPMEILMRQDVPVISRPGLEPKECVECAPWDEECRARQRRMAGIKAVEGESCSMNSDCQDGLTCNDDTFLCEGGKTGETGKTAKAGKGPKKFYAALTGGAGVGFMTKDFTVSQFDPDGNPGKNIPLEKNGYMHGSIDEINDPPKGMGWSGIPIRLAFGYMLTPKISLEISGRLDSYIIENSKPVNCWDNAGKNADALRNDSTNCSTDISEYNSYLINNGNLELSTAEITELAKHSAAMDENKRTIVNKKLQVAWLINARVRYKLLSKGGLQVSLFGGLGYGHIQFQVPDIHKDKNYYPLAGMVDIELGPGIAYYFTDNVGLVFDIPIDIMVGDGFAFNFDFNLGLGFGF